MSDDLAELTTSNPFDLLRKRKSKSTKEKPTKKPALTVKKPWNRLDKLLFSDNDAMALVGMDLGEELAWFGLCRFAVLRGTMEIGGFMSNVSEGKNWKDVVKSARVFSAYSPKATACLAWTCIEGVKKLKQYGSNLSEDEESKCLALLKKSGWSMDTFDGLLLILQDKSGIASLMNESSHSKDVWNMEVANWGVFGFQAIVRNEREGSPTFVQDKTWPILTLSEPWKLVMETLSTKHRIIVVVGGRNTGKSTFCRCLINHLLSTDKVAYMETDVGQGQFVPIGSIGVGSVKEPALGPGFVLPFFEKSYFYGSTSPKTDPDYYLELLRVMIQDIPSDSTLVINTHGWIQGMGYDLLCHFLSHLKVTDVVYLSKTPEDSILNLTTNLKATLYHLPPPPDSSLLKRFGAMDFRNWSLLAHLYSKGNDWSFEPPLAKRIPLTVPFSKVAIRFIHGMVPISETMIALNASLVALCHDSTCSPNSSINIYDIHHTQPDPSTLEFLGLGLIRGIDLQNSCFHILTPVPLQKLEHCNLLLRPHADAGITLPTSILTRGWDETLPYIQLGTVEGVGGKILGRRIQLPRKKFIQ